MKGVDPELRHRALNGPCRTGAAMLRRASQRAFWGAARRPLHMMRPPFWDTRKPFVACRTFYRLPDFMLVVRQPLV